MKDVDLINEAYAAQVQQLNEYGAAIASGARALAPKVAKHAAMTGATVGATNIANRMTGGDAEAPQQVVPEDGYDEEDNITDLEPGENITGIKKDAIIKTIIDSLDELIKGNTGADSPCGEREALELVERHCKGRLDEIGPAAAILAPAAISAVGGMMGGGDK